MVLNIVRMKKCMLNCADCQAVSSRMLDKQVATCVSYIKGLPSSGWCDCCCELYISEHEWFSWQASFSAVCSLWFGWYTCRRLFHHISPILSPLQNGQAGGIGRTCQQLSNSRGIRGRTCVACHALCLLHFLLFALSLDETRSDVGLICIIVAVELPAR